MDVSGDTTIIELAEPLSCQRGSPLERQATRERMKKIIFTILWTLFGTIEGYAIWFFFGVIVADVAPTHNLQSWINHNLGIFLGVCMFCWSLPVLGLILGICGVPPGTRRRKQVGNGDHVA